MFGQHESVGYLHPLDEGVGEPLDLGIRRVPACCHLGAGAYPDAFTGQRGRGIAEQVGLVSVQTCRGLPARSRVASATQWQ
jgi:hypothetical protein